MKAPVLLGTALSLLVAVPALAGPVKVGVILPQTGVGAVLAKQMQAAIELAVSHEGGKLGGQDVEFFWGDSQGKADVAKQLADEMVKSKRVEFLIGPLFSSEMMAVHGGLARTDAFVISPIAGPAPIAGKSCSANFFNVSSQNDQQAEALGAYLEKQGVKRVYAMTVNNQAGKDMVSGFKRNFKGELVGEVYTRFGQVDFAAELSALRTAAPAATFVFYPGDMGVQFVKQYAQAGLTRTTPLYTVWTVDQATLPAVGDDAIGVRSGNVWSIDLPNPVNARFVADFKQKNGFLPNDYAAHTYDSILLVSSAVKAVGGDMSRKDDIRKALKAAGFASNRGKFAYNSNNFPIENYYVREVVKDADGVLVTKTVETVMTDAKDAYYQECPLTK
ncbi:ABC transporter substrate-binding protein [Rhodoplanes sp. TEM]|uniref:ABC transporter substrate-binding protein n=1 Tax=Rhodoplanes tepidamans TaxID=200616 RepID=A0ABT5J6W0_RHOTP|nr:MULTISPECIES: ABC transporter substrate-binding protein [Rhodoplanes]MDC7785402.1 ABC transporter substrate-binding protein [Rhodoplanes tepidamans]MDC7984361.1 ABC transporter substrate-binding protein [Rhodoplanes sp. TEM]MDQ0353145.1 branched-chain amino acid transport system substrate-binding protein [Rhodoplanes tepidamans]